MLSVRFVAILVTAFLVTLANSHPSLGKDGFSESQQVAPIRTKRRIEDATRCGQPKKFTFLVQNGEKVTPGDWPWMAAIFTKKGTGVSFFCGGTLVSKSHVVTAAHCVKQKDKPVTNSRQLTVFLGKHNLLTFSETEKIQSRNVERIVVHPGYEAPGSSDCDLAMLVLSSPVTYSADVRPVCLWSEENTWNIAGTQGTVVGWGKDEKGNQVSEEPKLVRMPIVSQEECLRSHQSFHTLTSSNTFCAGNRDGSGPCNGDSGSGLYVSQTSAGGGQRWVLRGIVSLSLAVAGTGECDLSNYVVFTDLAKFAPWLKSLVPTESFITKPTSQARPQQPVVALKLVTLGDRQYYFSNSSHSSRVKWAAAREFCQRHGLQLASIETKEENQRIVAHINSAYSKYGPWLGGTDEGNEGQWVWDATKTPLTFKNWWTYQPDGGNKENCLYMYDDDGMWGDRSCTYTKPFVCEKH